MSEPITNLEDAVAALGALPMPAGSEPQMPPVDANRAKAPWGRGEDGRPLLPMGAHWTDVPELVDQYLADIQARVDGAQSGNWYVASTVETWRAPGTVCTRVDGYNRTVGQFTNVSAADLELALHAHGDLAWCLDMVAKLRDRVAELEAQRKADQETWQHDLRTARDEREATAVRIAGLEAERHVTNEALSDAAEALRANRDRITELERPAVERHRREVRESYRWLASHAREDGDFEGEAVVSQQLAEREQLWRQEDKLAREFAADPLAAKPWEPGPSAEASADRLTSSFAPTQALREDEAGVVFVPRTERSHWVTIADALNAAHAAGMPVGIDLDGTLTDHHMWSVVWDRKSEQWTVAGYEGAEDPCRPCGCPKRFNRHADGCPAQAPRGLSESGGAL